MVWFFKKQNQNKFSIHVEGDSVYFQRLVPFAELTPVDLELLDEAMKEAIKTTISTETWKMLDAAPHQGRPEVYQYIETVVDKFVSEFKLDKQQDHVSIHNYQCGLLIISVQTDHPEKFPHYYQGIQIKPYSPDRQLED